MALPVSSSSSSSKAENSSRGNVRYLPTTEAYDRWAAVYDTDGNFLQGIDDGEMKGWLFGAFLRGLAAQDGGGGVLLGGGGEGVRKAVGKGEEELEGKETKKKNKKVIDLGCGTGRNTTLLLDAGLVSHPGRADAGYGHGNEGGEGVRITDIVALDASPGMLAVAEARLLSGVSEGPRQSKTAGITAQDADGDNDNADAEGAKTGFLPSTTIVRAGEGHDDKTITFALFDIIAEAAAATAATPQLSPRQGEESQPPETTPTTAAAAAMNADGIISTLVLEHIPLAAYFSCAARLLRPGGLLLLTNMHAEMGALSQAGFVDTETGEKVRPEGSWAHTVGDVVEEAGKWGFEVVVGEDEDEDDDDDDEQRKEALAGDRIRGIREVAVDESMVERLGVRSKKWVGVTCWFGGLFRKVGP